MGKFLAVTFVVLLAGCTNPNAKITLENQGYKNVKLTGYQFMKCSDDDITHTGFQATSPSGVVVTGTVCEGVFKGKTIRLD